MLGFACVDLLEGAIPATNIFRNPWKGWGNIIFTAISDLTFLSFCGILCSLRLPYIVVLQPPIHGRFINLVGGWHILSNYQTKRIWVGQTSRPNKLLILNLLLKIRSNSILLWGTQFRAVPTWWKKRSRKKIRSLARSTMGLLQLFEWRRIKRPIGVGSSPFVQLGPELIHKRVVNAPKKMGKFHGRPWLDHEDMISLLEDIKCIIIHIIGNSRCKYDRLRIEPDTIEPRCNVRIGDRLTDPQLLG